MITLVLSILCLAFIGFLVILGAKALKGKAVSGSESLIGEIGKVKKTLEPEGIVFVSREDYTARSNAQDTIEAGAKVKVVALDGNKVIVEKI